MENTDHIEVGPILKQDKPIIYALDSDESSMILPEEKLSDRQRKIDAKYIRDNSPFGLAALCISDEEDTLIVDHNFEQKNHLIGWLSEVYRKIGLSVSSNVLFAKPKHFYSKALECAAEKKYSKISSTCVSYILNNYFDVSALLEASIKMNKKTALLGLSKKHGFDTPKALYVKNLTESIADVQETFAAADYPLFIKSDGLGGGSNISKVGTKEDLKNLESGNIDSDEVLVQACAPSNSLETISTFSVYPDKVEYIHTRGKMVADGQWYGNVFHPQLKLTPTQKKSLENAAFAAKAEGYASESGLLIGFDAFLHEDKALITEINARWLGSTPYEQLLKRLNILNSSVVVSSFDYIHISELGAYQDFVQENLFNATSKPSFSLIPISFSAYTEENDTLLVSYLVIGDFREFASAVPQALSQKSFLMLDTSREVYEKVLMYVSSRD